MYDLSRRKNPGPSYAICEHRVVSPESRQPQRPAPTRKRPVTPTCVSVSRPHVGGRRMPLLLAAIIGAALPSCNRPERTTYVEETPPAEKSARVAALKARRSPAPASRRASGESGPAIPFRWTLPEGWTAEANPAGSVRLVTFHISNHPMASCALYRLAPRRGALEASVRMWAAQVGRPDLSSGQAEKFLAAQRTVRASGGTEWTLLDFSTMAADPENGPCALAAVTESADGLYVLKMFGPAPDVKTLAASFERLVASMSPPRSPGETR